MKAFLDAHIHSKHSGATSKYMTITEMARHAEWKGVKILGTGDVLHPRWQQTLMDNLSEDGTGLYSTSESKTLFVASTEVSLEESRSWTGWKIHLVLLLPSLEDAKRISRPLFRYASNMYDGRPTLNLSPRDTVAMIRSECPEATIMAAHILTPWYSLFGSKFGFDSIRECFEDMADEINGLESGLSATPDMIRMMSELDAYPIVSFSDAHSPHNIGREATALEIETFSYTNLKQALRKPLFTIEFFPQHGKYHYDGHRKCGFSCTPEESTDFGGKCPKCGKKLTLGVAYRVSELKDRETPINVPMFYHHVPLYEIVAESMGRKPQEQIVKQVVFRLATEAGNEFKLMYGTPEWRLRELASERVADAIMRIRRNEVKVKPGYDGVYGEVRLWEDNQQSQMGLFK